MNSVVIGGTAGVGRELAIALAIRGDSLFITGKDKQDVDRCVTDLRIRYGVEVMGVSVDATHYENYLMALRDMASSFGPVVNLFLPIGASNEQDKGSLEISESSEIMSSNFMSVVLAIQALSPQFHESERVNIVGFSSIASIRGRGENVIYAASKRALESYFESLKLLMFETNIVVKYYRLGYLDTHQSYAKKLLFPRKDPEKVAVSIIANLERKRIVEYYPPYWRLVAILIRISPIWLYRKMSS
jgi:short-subunit dehydrogenase